MMVATAKTPSMAFVSRAISDNNSIVWMWKVS